jgi:hypothetical protein
MKKRRALRAVVTVQAGYIPSSHPLSPYVHVVVMVPKGRANVTVPTNCTTRVASRTAYPVWNQTFSIPVRRESDVLVFNVLDRATPGSVPRLRRASTSSRTPDPGASGSFFARHASLPRAGPGGSEGALSLDDDSVPAAPQPAPAPAEVPGSQEAGRNVAVCLLPIELIPEDGSVVRRRLELFEDPDGASGVGVLYVAARLEEVEVDQWEKGDLRKDHLISQFHRSRLSAFEDRFIGIGELAAFLYEEGYSQDRDANWDRAVTILSEQLAYRIYETTESTSDRANFLAAKAQVERDQGLWDGI